MEELHCIYECDQALDLTVGDEVDKYCRLDGVTAISVEEIGVALVVIDVFNNFDHRNIYIDHSAFSPLFPFATLYPGQYSGQNTIITVEEGFEEIYGRTDRVYTERSKEEKVAKLPHQIISIVPPSGTLLIYLRSLLRGTVY